jgi:histone-lysine N-methyltransferase SETMAR
MVPHPLSDPRKLKRVDASTELLQILNDLEADSFDGIASGDESWFQYLYESSAMGAKSPGDVTPRTRQGIGVKKTMFTIFFTDKKLLIADYHPKGQKYNQDYFISDIFSELEREKMGYERRKQGRIFFVYQDHPKSHEGGKTQGKFDMKGLVRALHPPYSPDLSPCDFWFFRMAKGKMKDREFHAVQGIRGLTEIWNDLTFEDVQSVFLEWKVRLNWVIENGGEYSSQYNKKNDNLFGRHFQGILSARLSDTLSFFTPVPSARTINAS